MYGGCLLCPLYPLLTKVNELPNDWAWSDGTKAANWGSRNGYRCGFFLFFFAVIHPTCKHALRKESAIKRSVDDLELFDDQRRKSTRIIWFLSSPRSGFHHISPVNALVPTFEKLQSSFTTDLYYHECCLIKLALEKLNRREQLLDREANSKVIC